MYDIGVTMDLEELEDALHDILPDFQIGTDKKGQLIIYTGLHEDEDGQLVDMDSDEEDEDFDPDFEPLEDEEELDD